MLRRSLYALIVLSLFNYPAIQMQVFFIMNMVYVIYISLRPHNLSYHNWQEMFNEVCYFLLGYHVIMFSAIDATGEMKNTVGWSMIVITAI